MKIVYNRCYGGFSLSEAAIKLGRKLSGNPEWPEPCLVGDTYSNGEVIKVFYGGGRSLERDDKILVAVVEQLGKAANGAYSELCITDLPQGTLWHIDEYDGYESVATQDSYDWQVAT